MTEKKPPSAKSLFRAISGRASGKPGTPRARGGPAARNERRAFDLYPTGEPDAIRGLFAADRDRIHSACRARADYQPAPVWEPAAGFGHMAREIEAAGFSCAVSDIADHGCAGVEVRSFYDFDHALAPAIITNPPYCEINARDGHGRWLRHTLAMPGWRYCALLLSWDWPAARINGLGELLDEQPFSWCYLMRWKLDFTGEGSPPQRNAWFVWDRDRRFREPVFRFMNRPAPAAPTATKSVGAKGR